MASDAEKVAPTAGLDAKDFVTTDTTKDLDGTPGTTPSVQSEELVQGDYGSDRHHVFAEPKVADYWRDIYEKAQYEGRHRFDPDITWSADEEKKLKRKVNEAA